MAPKTTGKEAKEDEQALRLDKQWSPSMTTAEDLKELVMMGVMLDQETAGWRPSSGESYPMPNTHELVVFEDYFIHGFGVPVHPFFHKLIDYYKISLCNLNANSILHISMLN